jgi:hypothetical protein
MIQLTNKAVRALRDALEGQSTDTVRLFVEGFS